MGEKFLHGAAKRDAGNSPSATSVSTGTPGLKRVRRTLKRSEILSGRNNFQLVFKQGKKFQGKFLQCLVLADDHLKLRGGAGTGVGFTAPGVLKKAVDRNRLKRLAREAYRLNKEILASRLERSSTPLAMVFLYSSAVTRLPRFPAFAEIELDMKNLLKMLAEGELGKPA